MTHKPWLGRYPAGVPAEADIHAFSSLAEMLEASCERFAGLPAFTNMGTTLPFRELEHESRAFAARLERLALKWSCLPLLAYAQTLSRHAENYAILDLEKDLQEFSALVDRIADSASK